MRETPAQRYETGQDGTRGEAGHPAHNPKVAGSNPAPATIENPCSGRPSGLPLGFSETYGSAADCQIEPLGARPGLVRAVKSADGL